MKPSLDMEKPQLPATIVMQPEPDTTKKKSYTRRWVIGVVLGLITVIVITAVVLVSVHLTAKITRDNYKKAVVTFLDAQGEEVITEDIVITETEEDIEVKDKVRIIYDYARGLMVVQMTKPGDEQSGTCYISTFNTSAEQTLDKTRDEMTGDEIERTVPTDTQERTFESLGEQADRDLLSPRAREMCEGYPLYWARESDRKHGDLDARQKRSCYYYVYFLYCDYWYCYYYWWLICY